MEPKAGEESDDKDIAGPSDKSNLEERTENGSPMPSSAAPAAIHSDTAVEEEIGESGNETLTFILLSLRISLIWYPDRKSRLPDYIFFWIEQY